MGSHLRLLTDYTANGSFASLKENITYYNEPNYAVLVRTTDLKRSKFEPARFTDERGYYYLKKSTLFPGDIVIANVGSAGEVFRVPDFAMPMTLAPNMYLVRFKASIDGDFAFQLLRSRSFKERLLAQTGSTTLKAINKRNFRSIKVIVPPLPEQEKIAAILSSVDEAIRAKRAVIEQTRRVKEGLLQELLTRGIGHSRFKQTEIGEIPEEWEVRALGDFAAFKNGLNFAASDRGNHGVPTVDVKNMYADDHRVPYDGLYRVDENVASDLLLRSGDLLFVRSSVKKEGIAWTVLAEEPPEPTSFCGFIIRARINRPGLLPEFALNAMHSPAIRSWLIDNAKHAAITNIGQADLGRIKLPVPPEWEQQQINNLLREVLDVTAVASRLAERFDRVKAGLLQDLLTGKVRVTP